MNADISLSAQLINLFASVILLLAFAMLAQRRVLPLINLFALQGLTLCLSTLVVAFTTGQAHLYGSAALTLVLKAMLLPWILHRLVRQLQVRADVEGLINIPTASRQTLSNPWALSSRMSEEKRWATSPRNQPPMVVFTRSVTFGGSRSSPSSHIRLPPIENIIDPKKP